MKPVYPRGHDVTPRMIMDQRRKRLSDLIRERSFRRGNFTLASGKESAYYFDSKPTMLHPEGAAFSPS